MAILVITNYRLSFVNKINFHRHHAINIGTESIPWDGGGGLQLLNSGQTITFLVTDFLRTKGSYYKKGGDASNSVTTERVQLRCK